MYADDTTLYFNLEDIDSVNLNENINIHLEKINVWLKGECSVLKKILYYG